jgi:hypothetical protein
VNIQLLSAGKRPEAIGKFNGNRKVPLTIKDQTSLENIFVVSEIDFKEILNSIHTI